MWKGCFLAILLYVLSMPVMAAGNYIPKQFANTNTGEGMYPYSLNNRRNETVNTQKRNNVSGIGGAAPMQSVGKRGVVKRPSPARAATTMTNTDNRRVVPRSNVARSGTNTNAMRNTYSGNRNVVARSDTRSNGLHSTNVRSTTIRRQATNTTTSSSTVSSQKCFANYKECMEMYCKREDTAYNRCYCSAKLAQIDSKYQKAIDEKIQKIIILQNTTIKPNPDEEQTSVEDYWDETVGQYTQTNPWVNIDKALDIKWPDTETRFRGQNAFNTGHEYCVAHLRACSYMATNMRDAYKSEIARDCATYESTLQKIQYAAESVIANYDE